MVSDITDENDYHSSQGSGFNQVVLLISKLNAISFKIDTPLTFLQDK